MAPATIGAPVRPFALCWPQVGELAAMYNTIAVRRSDASAALPASALADRVAAVRRRFAAQPQSFAAAPHAAAQLQRRQHAPPQRVTSALPAHMLACARVQPPACC